MLRHVNISVLGSLLTECHGELLYLNPRIALPEEDLVDESRIQSKPYLFPPDASVHFACSSNQNLFPFRFIGFSERL